MSERDPKARLLLRAPNWLGDAVMAIPAMSALRVAYPDSHLTVAAPGSVAALFGENTPVSPDAVLALPAERRAERAALAAGDFETCVLFPNSFRTAWDARRVGIANRWGYGTAGRSWLLTRAIHKPRGSSHQADYYRSLVRGLGVSCDESAPELTVSPASLERAATLLRHHRWPADAKYVAVMPGAAYGQAKQWPADRMAEVVSRLVRDCAVRCVVLGASNDRAAARAIESWLRERAPKESSFVLDLTGETTIGVLAGLLSRADVCVSNDSGGMHVAAALGRPVVAVFGPTDEGVTRPLGNHAVITEPVFCRPCMLRDCPIDHRCMKRISVDRVFEAAASRVSSAGAG